MLIVNATQHVVVLAVNVLNLSFATVLLKLTRILLVHHLRNYLLLLLTVPQYLTLRTRPDSRPVSLIAIWMVLDNKLARAIQWIKVQFTQSPLFSRHQAVCSCCRIISMHMVIECRTRWTIPSRLALRDKKQQPQYQLKTQQVQVQALLEARQV